MWVGEGEGVMKWSSELEMTVKIRLKGLEGKRCVRAHGCRNDGRRVWLRVRETILLYLLPTSLL